MNLFFHNELKSIEKSKRWKDDFQDVVVYLDEYFKDNENNYYSCMNWMNIPFKNLQYIDFRQSFDKIMYIKNLVIFFPISNLLLERYIKRMNMTKNMYKIVIPNKNIDNIYIVDNTNNLVRDWIRKMPYFDNYEFYKMIFPDSVISELTLMLWRKIEKRKIWGIKEIFSTKKEEL